MQLERKLMGDALKATVIPHLRELGFAGTLPHFRRKRSGRHELLSIMFNKYGGSFYLEAGAMSGQRYVELQRHWADAGKELPESKLDIGHCKWDQRLRLGASTGIPQDSDHWFVFASDRLAPSTLLPSSHYAAVASQALAAIQLELALFYGQSAAPLSEA